MTGVGVGAGNGKAVEVWYVATTGAVVEESTGSMAKSTLGAGVGEYVGVAAVIGNWTFAGADVGAPTETGV